MAAIVVYRLALDRPDARSVAVAPEGVDRDAALLRVDVDLAAAPDTLAAPLSQLALPGLDEPLIDALRSSEMPAPSAGLRVAATADLLAHHAPDTPVRLSLRRLWLVAGAGWILTAHHPAEVVGAGEPEPLTRDDLQQRIERAWHPWPSAAADDLATLVLLELVSAWPAALERLADRQAELERAYLEDHAEDVKVPTSAAADLQAELALLRRQLVAVERQLRGLARPGRDPVSAWFRAHGTEAESLQLAAVLDACRAEVAALLDAQRATLQLIAGQAAVDQLQLADAAAQRGRALQQLVAWLTGVLLVPTLVATVFGALPGILEDCPQGRALLVVGVTVATMLAGALTAKHLVGPPSIRLP